MINNKNIYSISEVAQCTGFKSHVIRFYEKEFNIIIPRGENNRRYFTNREIDQLLYIKQLQSDGISNKQIKDILQTQENIQSEVNICDEIALTTISNAEEITRVSKLNSNVNVELKHEILMILEKYNCRNEISELKQQIDELSQQLNNPEKNRDKDVLICENAKLKLKVKEKSYEIAELKDKLKRQEQKKISIFQRLFKIKSAH